MELLKFKDKRNAKSIILNLAHKHNQIIHGQQSQNYQLPYNLQRETNDYDIYTKNAKLMAEKLVKELKKEYGEDYYIEPAIHKGTFKVKDVMGNTVADYTTQKGRKPKSKNIFGVRYSELSYSENKAKQLIKNKMKEFRREKDLDTLRRIKQYKRIKVW
jgi:hypothetical protein